MQVDAPKAADHNGCLQIIHLNRKMGVGLKSPDVLARGPSVAIQSTESILQLRNLGSEQLHW